MDLILLLRIIIFLVFCLVGVLVGGQVGDYKRVDLSKKSAIEECKDEICPVPKN